GWRQEEVEESRGFRGRSDLEVGSEGRRPWMKGRGRRGRTKALRERTRPFGAERACGRRPGPTFFCGAHPFWRHRAHREGGLPGPSDRPPAGIAVRHAG